MQQNHPREIELLAPARNMSTAIAAIDHGADAVYMGAPLFGARSQAGNSLDDISIVAGHAHRFGVRLYVTVNTIVYDSELPEVERLIWRLWRAGVDAVIVQDLAIKDLRLPPIALHASTQCDTRTPAKARFLESIGFTRLVLARELTVSEIRDIRNAVAADLEVFVHGALCVSYSGDCQASYAITGRSANRGECCQVCRFKFDLEDDKGNKLIQGKHLLSLRDMNRLDNLEELLEAGVGSLKIEGRLKDETYVKNVVAAYRSKLDAIIASHPDKYRRASYGISTLRFKPDLEAVFNRGFTNYFLTGKKPEKGSLATFGSPKWIGRPVGKMLHSEGRSLMAILTEKLSNGDGLGYYTSQGEFQGFRLNRVEGNCLYPASKVDIPVGTVLYRNGDKAFGDLLSGKTAVRKIAVDLQLEIRNGMLLLSLSDESGAEATVAEEISLEKAKSPQLGRRRSELEKFGDTVYYPRHIADECGDNFIAASILSRLRRKGVEALDAVHAATYKAEKPGKPASEIALPEGHIVTRHDNIANSLTAGFYAKLTGIPAESLPQAIEVGQEIEDDAEDGIRVMQTRYCLRRELGKCLKTADGNKLPRDLYLTSDGKRFRLDFDCRNCLMNVFYQTKSR